jgi:hypothetical protein
MPALTRTKYVSPCSAVFPYKTPLAGSIVNNSRHDFKSPEKTINMGLPSVLPGHYNATLVTISITIAILTAAASLCVAGRIAAATDWLQFAWPVTAGITMGLGIACTISVWRR